jgi:hypothetical protein
MENEVVHFAKMEKHFALGTTQLCWMPQFYWAWTVLQMIRIVEVGLRTKDRVEKVCLTGLRKELQNRGLIAAF